MFSVQVQWRRRRRRHAPWFLPLSCCPARCRPITPLPRHPEGLRSLKEREAALLKRRTAHCLERAPGLCSPPCCERRRRFPRNRAAMATPPVGEHGTAARGSPPNGPPEAAQRQQEQQQREQQAGDGQQEAASPPPPDAAGARQQVAADALAAQFQAQLEALTAISMGQIAPDSTVLAACGGRIPAAAVRAACPPLEPQAASMLMLAQTRPPALLAALV